MHSGLIVCLSRRGLVLYCIRIVPHCTEEQLHCDTFWILCLSLRGWQALHPTLGNAYTHNDRSSSRLSGLSSLVLLSFNCYLHGSKREAIYIHNCNFRGPNTSGGNHQSLLTEDSEHTRTGLRPDKMMIFHLVDRRILFLYRKNGN